MTKVGEGNTPGKGAGAEEYHKQLKQACHRFLKALESYKDGAGEERSRFRAIMDKEIGVIRSAVEELKRSGFHKQDVLLEKSYKSFLETGADEDYSALKHNAFTLREYNNLPQSNTL